jgi:hypothetical protein
MAGTVGISSVGMFGNGHTGWEDCTGSHGLDLVVGVLPGSWRLWNETPRRQPLALHPAASGDAEFV